MKLHRADFVKIAALVLISIFLMGAEGPRGLNGQAYLELHDAGVDKYLGQFEPALLQNVGDGWTKHTFDPAGGAGPICIAGTPYPVFTRAGNPSRLPIFEQGGGACWQDYYNCNILAEDQEPPAPTTGNSVSTTRPVAWTATRMATAPRSSTGGSTTTIRSAWPSAKPTAT